MMARRGVLGVVAASATAMLAGCGSWGGNSYRYKMRVEVDTPAGPASGFAVREIRRQANGTWFPFGESRPQAKVRGEAVAVDLPDGSIIFALLRGNGGEVDYAKHIPVRAQIMQANGPVELWPTHANDRRFGRSDPFPMLVTFRDIDDPASVEKVDPANLAATFGEGVSLKRITVEVTDEPVTTGIEQRLSWLPKYYGRQFNGDRFQNLESLKRDGLSAVLSAGSFSAGLGLVGKD